MDTDAPELEPDDTPDEPTDSPADLELAHRLWLKAAIPMLQARSHESDPSPRVQFALDLAAVAVCERIGRICRSDLPAARA